MGQFSSDESGVIEQALIGRLLAPNESERIKVIVLGGLEKFGKQSSVSEIVRSLGQDRKAGSLTPSQVLAAIRVLSKLGGEIAEGWIISMLEDDGYSTTKEDLVVALGRIGGQRAVVVLSNMLNSVGLDPRVRVAILKALASIRKKEVVRPSERALNACGMSAASSGVGRSSATRFAASADAALRAAGTQTATFEEAGAAALFRAAEEGAEVAAPAVARVRVVP